MPLEPRERKDNNPGCAHARNTWEKWGLGVGEAGELVVVVSLCARGLGGKNAKGA